MKTINSTAELKIVILQLELHQEIQGQILKEQFVVTINSFTPINLIKKALNDVASSPYLIDNIISTSMGLITGYISKSHSLGSSNSLFRKLLGSVLQFGVTNILAQHPEIFKSVGHYLMDKIFHKKIETTPEP